MRKIMLGMLFVVVAIIASAEGDGESPPDPRLADLPVRESPVGDHVFVGQWEVFLYSFHETWPFSRRATAINGWALQRTALAHSYDGENREHSATALELREDGHQDWQPGAGRFGSSGHRLAIYISDAERRGAHRNYYKTDHGFDPDKAFMLPGRTDRPYSLAADIRWWTDGDILNINNGRHKLSFRYSVLSDDVIWLVSGYGHVFLIVRIGPATQRMQAFNDCVLGNKGRKAWDVTPCQNPLPGAAKVAGS